MFASDKNSKVVFPDADKMRIFNEIQTTTTNVALAKQKYAGINGRTMDKASY